MTLGPGRRLVRGSRLSQAAILLALAYAFVSVATVLTHEAGHLALDRAYRADVRIVAPLFGAPRIEPIGAPVALPRGWPDAAGPLANVGVGLVLLPLLWRRRRPGLLPLLLWAPVALLQEGVDVLVQLATQAPGSDLVRVAEAGVSVWLLASLGAIAVVVALIAPLAVLMDRRLLPQPGGRR